jgi:hypothetical protein
MGLYLHGSEVGLITLIAFSPLLRSRPGRYVQVSIVSWLWSSPPNRLWRQQASRLSRVGYFGDSQWHVWDMYASVGKCIITFSESLETILTTYCTKRRSSSKISNFLSKVTSFLHLFLIKSTNIYNNRKTWSENSETSPNIFDCIH